MDTILDKDVFTLEELLDEDELVQETKSLNPRLIEFLKQKETVRSLVRYMVVDADDGENAGDEMDGDGAAGEGAGSDVGADRPDEAGEGAGVASAMGAGGRDGESGTEVSDVSGRTKGSAPGGVLGSGGEGQFRLCEDQDNEPVGGSGHQYQALDASKKIDASGTTRSSMDSQGSVDHTRRCFKYPFTACEIFCCEVEGIYNTLLENEDILRLFFSILDKRARPLNTILAGYFSRVMGALLARRSSDIVLYLQSNPGILNKLVYHVDTTSVAEVLARLAGADDPVGYNESPSVTWLANTDILQLLVKSLGNDTPSEGQANAAEVLAAIARSTATQLTKSMANAGFMQELVDAALSEHSGTAASHALNVCLALLEPLTVDPTMGRFPVTDIHDLLRQEAVRCLSQESTLERLVRLLDVAHNSEWNSVNNNAGSDVFSIDCLATTYGHVKPPVGQLRLKIVDLLASLFRTTDPMAEQAVMKTTAVKRTMEMFLEYPFNNALHGGVTMLLTAFEEGSEELRRYLMEEVKLVEWIANAPRKLNNVSAAEKTMVHLRKNNTELRAGYCGHLTQIANRLQRCAETCEYMKSFLEKSTPWREYKEQELDARNRVESVLAWKCGRPASQGVGLHGMYSSGLGYGDLGHGDDDIGDEFDSDHNRFTALDVGDLSVEVNHEVGGDQDGNAEELGEGADDGLVKTSEDTAVTNGDSSGERRVDPTLAKMASANSGHLSMEDMDGDEVCFDMDADEETTRQREADATDGLLELGDDLARLAVTDGDGKNTGGTGWD